MQRTGMSRRREWMLLVAVLVSFGAAHGCSGKRRPFAIGDSSGTAAGDGSVPGADQEQGALLPDEGSSTGLDGLGAPCVGDAACDSGFCVAGRCCDRLCDGVCEACSASGRCDIMPADDLRCPVLACETTNVCATFDETQAINRCGSLGACKTACDPVTVATDTVCAEVAPGIEGVCNDAGDCVDPRARLGAACQSDLECAEGTCVDGVCCVEACDGVCEACDAAGACGAEAQGTSCGDGLQCFGRGVCSLSNGSACGSGAECGSDYCEPALGGGTICCAEPCPDGQLCNGDGACVTPESDLGTPCTNDGDCIGGRCADGVCCDTDCAGGCEVCNAPGQTGRCSSAPIGSADPLCTGGRQCAGRGLCLLPLGAACSFNGDCGSGECGPALEGAGEICCEGVCSNGQRCSPTGSCVDAPDPNGNPCSANSDCQSNSCVNGRCCENACNGTCQACSGLGICNVSPGNDTRCAQVDCPTSNTVCVSYPADLTANLCASFGTCRNAQQECQPRFAARGTRCENVAPGVAGQCDGAGGCADPRFPRGAPCGSSLECQSGNCVAGICCDSPCNEVCEACGTNGICAFRDRGACPLGQQCATRATCSIRSVNEGASCANGEACINGACIDSICRGQCRIADNSNVGSLIDQCVLAP